MRAHILTALGLLLGACSADSVPPPPKPPVGPLQPVAILDAGTNVVTEKEKALPEVYARILSAPAPDGGATFSQLAPLLNADLAQFSFPGLPPANEPPQIIGAFDKLFGAFDNRKLLLSRVWRTPSEQTLEWTMTGTHAREWMGIAATQKPVAIQGVTLMWTKDDGSIIDIHLYFDVALLKAQLSGVGPKELLAVPPPPAPSGPSKVFEQTTLLSGDEARNVAVVKGSLDALESNRENDYLASFSDDVAIDTLERDAQPARGKDAVRGYYRGMHKAVGQLDTTVNNAWGVAQFAIVEYATAGEQLGALGWIPAQRDQVVRLDAVDVCEIVMGKIAHVWRYDNPMQIYPGGLQATLPVTMAAPSDAPLPAMPPKLPSSTPTTSAASATPPPPAPPPRPRKPTGAK